MNIKIKFIPFCGFLKVRFHLQMQHGTTTPHLTHQM